MRALTIVALTAVLTLLSAVFVEMPVLYGMTTVGYGEVIGESEEGTGKVDWMIPLYYDDDEGIDGWMYVDSDFGITRERYIGEVCDRAVPRISSPFGCCCAMFSLTERLTADDILPFRIALRNAERVSAHDYTDYQKAMCVKALCNGIAYVEDSVHYSEEYWQTPIETLYLGRGDCEDMAVLFCAVSGCIGLDCALLHLDSHIMGAVDLGGKGGKTVGRWTMVECTDGPLSRVLSGDTEPSEVRKVIDSESWVCGWYARYVNGFASTFGLR